MNDLLAPSSDELWEQGCRDIDETIEEMRGNLLDRGVEANDALQNVLDGERVKMQEELGRNLDGDLEFAYEMPDFDELASRLSESFDIAELSLDTEMLSDENVAEICDAIAEK